MGGFRTLRSVAHALVLAGVAALLAYALAGDRGRLAILGMEAARTELLDRIAVLEAENRELALTVRQLRRPDFAAERVSREALGLVREGELVFVDGRLVTAAPAP